MLHTLRKQVDKLPIPRPACPSLYATVFCTPPQLRGSEIATCHLHIAAKGAQISRRLCHNDINGSNEVCPRRQGGQQVG